MQGMAFVTSSMADDETNIRHRNRHAQELWYLDCYLDSPRPASIAELLRLDVTGSSPNCTDVLLAFDKPMVVRLPELFLDHGKRSRLRNFVL